MTEHTYLKLRLRHYLRKWNRPEIVECIDVQFFLGRAYEKLGEEEFKRIALEEGVPPEELR